MFKSSLVIFLSDAIVDNLIRFLYPLLFLASKIKLSFVGKRSHTIPLTENCIKDIVEVYNLYIAYKSMHTSEVERIKIMRRLQLARKQVKQTATNLQGNK